MKVHNHGTEEGDGLACRTHYVGKCVVREMEERARQAEEKLEEIKMLVKCVGILNTHEQDPMNDYWIEQLTEILGDN